MAKQKKNKDKKDKKKNKDRDRQKERQKKDKKKRDRKRSYSSSSSSSSDSSDSSSSSRERSKKKETKIKKKDKKEVKTQAKSTNNPYDFQKTAPKGLSGFPVGLPTPGFSVPIMHPTPPPPIMTGATTIAKPKTRQIHIFKILPKLPYGCVLMGKTLYSSELIQEKIYNRLLRQMIQQVESKVKQQNNKKGINIISKCSSQIEKIISAEEQSKKSKLLLQGSSNKQFLPNYKTQSQQNNRFKNLQTIYNNYFKN